MTKPFSPIRIVLVLAIAAGVACRSCATSQVRAPSTAPSAARPIPAPWLRAASLPVQSASWTSTRDVSGLLLSGDGSLWASTRGGVLRRDAKGRWRKWTRRDGLPSHEARAVERAADGRISVLFPQHSATWDSAASTWNVQALPTPAPAVEGDGEQAARVESRARWRGQACVASLDGLQIGARKVALPSSEGTHISALLAQSDGLWAAMFGDGLWKWDGKSWSRPQIQLPNAAREVTALAGSESDLWLGTRRAGVWHRRGKAWTQHIQGDEPLDANVQSLALFGGVLWASTLEDGLQARTLGGWKHFGSPTLSSDAPRQMAVFGGALYVRHGGGAIDRFDGARWARNVFPWLPRHKALGLAGDGKKLAIAQWGGWSEWDGSRWTHAFPASMANIAIPSLLREDSTLWIGTQSRGLAQWNDAQAGSDTPARWHDERDGLGDDWITALARSDKMLAAGTFVGGLSLFDGQKWSAPILDGENVTALEGEPGGGFFIATRHGTWHRDAGGSMHRIGGVDEEAQALLRQGAGLWIGTRTGLFWVADADGEAPEPTAAPQVLAPRAVR